MAITTPHGPAITCAESIAALHFLHNVPVLPSSNPVTDIQNRSVGYALSFDKERSLAGTLAFLAYPKEDADHIPAVCIEEGPGYLNALLAINKASRDGGQGVLSELKTGFEEIFTLLSRISDGSQNVENNVFKAIITMCSRRILHRLRLISNRGTQRQSIREALRRALEYLKHSKQEQSKDANLFPVLSAFIERAGKVLKLIDSWVGYHDNSQLEGLVEGIRHLQESGDLRALFKTIPNLNMDPSSRSHLLNMIRKVARYRESARFLYRMAKKNPVARNLRIVIVQFPEKAFKGALSDGYTPKLEATMSLINGLKKKDMNLANICRLLRTNEKLGISQLDEEKANSQFSKQTQRTLQKSKIHAEIQLIYHCELNVPKELLPRVICSSKNACWLCNEFILMYEKIHTPKSHGRLYPGWRLPMLGTPEFNDIARGYNQRLLGHLKNSLKTLFTRRERTVYPTPNESSLLTLILSDSTLSSDSLPLSDSTGQRIQDVVVFPKGEQEQGGSSHISALADDEGSEETLAQGEKIPLEVIPRKETPPEKPLLEEAQLENTPRDTPSSSEETISEMPECPSIDGTSNTSSSIVNNLALERGKAQSKGIRIGKASPLYTTGPLEIQIEYAGTPDPETPRRLQKKLSCTVKWLEQDDVKKLKGQGKVPIFNIESLKGEMEYQTDKDGYLYLSYGEAVLRLFMQPVAVSLP